MSARSKPGPKVDPKISPARRLDGAGQQPGGMPEPDPTLDGDELAVFNQLLAQTGGHLKLADSAPLSLLARQLVEERQLKKAMSSIDPAHNPNEFLGARRALTSLQTASSNSMKLLGIGPKARASSVTLQPLPTKQSANAVVLPFVNDTKLTDKAALPLAEVCWSGIALDEAEKKRQADGAALPSLACLCEHQHKNQVLLRLMGSNGDADKSMGVPLPEKLFNLVCKAIGEDPF